MIHSNLQAPTFAVQLKIKPLDVSTFSFNSCNFYWKIVMNRPCYAIATLTGVSHAPQTRLPEMLCVSFPFFVSPPESTSNHPTDLFESAIPC